LMIVYGDPHKVEFFGFFVNAIQSVRPEFTGPPMDPPPLPFQLQDPERLRKELAAAGLKNIKVETLIEITEFQSGGDLWKWVIWSNPIAEAVLEELSLTDSERTVIQQTLEPIREVLESDESDVIHWRALDSRWSAACGSPNTAKLRTAAAFVTRAI
jgi:hypothetical protein